MDLNDFIWRQADRLQRQLQELLEKPSSETGLEEPPPFSVSTNLSLMEDTAFHLPMDFHPRAQSLFLRMSPFFEAGVLFQRHQSCWAPSAAFQKGMSSDLSPQERRFEFEFPEMTLVEVKKASSRAVIEDLGFEDSLLTEKVEALVFRPHPDLLVLVLSELATPWMKLQIDRAQRIFLKILSDDV